MIKNRLDEKFEELKSQGKKALIAYLAAGYPEFPEQEKLICVMKDAGVDILELGIPYSDPMADGPTIQFASQESLKAGTTLRKILAWAKGFYTSIDLPLIAMSYVNPILQYGYAAFAADAKAAGLVAVIVPDLIPEEGEELENALAAQQIHMIYLIAPTSPRPRQKFVASKTSGFLYAVSVAGVTGARRALPTETCAWLAGLKKISKAPVCVGFGISGPAQVRELREAVDGFIVGSAVIDVIRKNDAASRPAAMKDFIRGLSEECSHAR